MAILLLAWTRSFTLERTIPRRGQFLRSRTEIRGGLKPIWTGIEINTLGLTDSILREGRFEHVKVESEFFQVLVCQSYVDRLGTLVLATPMLVRHWQRD